MKKTNCLNEQELLLYYYAELADMESTALHLADCPGCTVRLATLSRDLDQLPDPYREPGPVAATRMAARVSEQLRERRRSWLPALGATAVAALALVASISLWPQQTPQQQPTRPATTSLAATMNIDEDMPDLEFLEDFELLKNLELLSQIEGV